MLQVIDPVLDTPVSGDTRAAGALWCWCLLEITSRASLQGCVRGAGTRKQENVQKSRVQVSLCMADLRGSVCHQVSCLPLCPLSSP